MFTWPYRLLTPAFPKFSIDGAVTDGGTALSGFSQVAEFGGGGFWRADYPQIQLRTPDQILAFRAWMTHLRSGARSAIFPCWDFGLSPRGQMGARLALGGLPAPAADGDWFAWDPGFGAKVIVAHLDDPAARRATSVKIRIDEGGAVRGGQSFSLLHAVWGWRLYEIERVTARAGNVFTVEIWPPLREAAPDNMAVEFDTQRCVMTLDPTAAKALRPAMNGTRSPGSVSITLREAGKPV